MAFARVEAIIWTLKTNSASNATAAAHPPGSGPESPQRLPGLNAVIWHNWQIGASVKRSLTAYDH